MQKITPHLWFDNQAEEAANFYISLFKNSHIVSVNRAGEAVMSLTFHLDGQDVMALNGGPHFKFNEAISLFVNCEDQAEVDRLWNALTEGGEESQCGWLKDKYGLSWQIVPSVLGELLGNPDPVKAQNAMKAMLQMKKLDIKALQDVAQNG